MDNTNTNNIDNDVNENTDINETQDGVESHEEILPPEMDPETLQALQGEEPTSLDQARIQSLEEELASMKDKALRAMAEAENTRRRAEKDREDASKYAIASFAKNLLPVADNFRRAIDAVPEDLKQDNDVIKNLMAGIEATERELQKAFALSKIEIVNPMGEIFDPNFHEVLFEMPAPGQKPGTVMQVVEVGYKIHDRILRPARVGVAKGDGSEAHEVDTVA